MGKNALLKNGMAEKDAVNGMNVLAASGWLLDNLRGLRIASSSKVMDHLSNNTMNDLGQLHQKMLSFVEAIYIDLEKNGFHEDSYKSTLPVRADENTDMDIYDHTDCVDTASALLVQRLREMLRTNSPIINDTAVGYLKEASRITQRLSLLTMALKSGPYVDETEESAHTPSSGTSRVKP